MPVHWAGCLPEGLFSLQPAPGSHLTFSVGLHSGGGVDCVSKETVTGHLQPYHTGTHGSWREWRPISDRRQRC